MYEAGFLIFVLGSLARARDLSAAEVLLLKNASRLGPTSGLGRPWGLRRHRKALTGLAVAPARLLGQNSYADARADYSFGRGQAHPADNQAATAL